MVAETNYSSSFMRVYGLNEEKETKGEGEGQMMMIRVRFGQN